jgi:hypothetical protein
MATGVLVVRTALMTLLIGSMMVITLSYLRGYPPAQYLHFGKFWLKITAVSSTCSMTAKLVTLGLVILLL